MRLFRTRFWTQGFPLKCDFGRQASPLQLELGSESSRYRRLDRKWLGPKISKSRFLKYFLETTFFCFMLPWSLWAENIFSVFLENIFSVFLEIFFSDQNLFKSKYFLKVFLESTFVHVSCYSDHNEPKIFFRFSKFATTLRYKIFDSRFLP